MDKLNDPPRACDGRLGSHLFGGRVADRREKERKHLVLRGGRRRDRHDLTIYKRQSAPATSQQTRVANTVSGRHKPHGLTKNTTWAQGTRRVSYLIKI